LFSTLAQATQTESGRGRARGRARGTGQGRGRGRGRGRGMDSDMVESQSESSAGTSSVPSNEPLPKATQTVTELIVPFTSMRRNITMDNFFTSVHLAKELEKVGFFYLQIRSC
jgi:hypothetical protein